MNRESARNGLQRRRVGEPAARAVHRPADAALRGSAARARRWSLHRRHLDPGADIGRVRAHAARPRIDRSDRHLGRARASRRARGPDRRRLRRRRSSRHGALSQSGRCHRHQDSDLRAQPERKILDELQLPLAAGRVRFWAKRSRSWWRRASSPRATPPRRSWSNTRPCRRSPMSRKRCRTTRRRSGRTHPAISRSTTRSATAPRSRPPSRAPMSWSSRPSATSAPRAPDGAALGHRPLRRGRGPIHFDFGQPGRASRPPCAGGLPQGAAGTRAGDLPRCRRRLRLAHQSLSRAGHDRVGGAPGRPSGEMDQRSPRGIPHRLHRARPGDHGAARVRPRRPHAGARPRAHRHYRRAYRDVCSAEQRLSRRDHGLRHADRCNALARR